MVDLIENDSSIGGRMGISCSEIYYQEYIYKSKRWVKLWGDLFTGAKKVSPQTANKEIRHLKATFNYGIKKCAITKRPCYGDLIISPLKSDLSTCRHGRAVVKGRLH